MCRLCRGLLLPRAARAPLSQTEALGTLPLRRLTSSGPESTANIARLTMNVPVASEEYDDEHDDDLIPINETRVCTCSVVLIAQPAPDSFMCRQS